jgi:hypothetical protein
MDEGDGLIEGYSFLPPLTPLERRYMELASDVATHERISAELGLPVVAVQTIEVDIMNKLVDHQRHPTSETTDQLAIVRNLRSGHGYTGPTDRSLEVLQNVHASMHG